MLRQEFGLNQTLRLLEVPKSTWYYYRNEKKDFEDKYSCLRSDLMKAIRSNPIYGYRKLQVELKEVYESCINHKTLKKLLNVWDVALPRRIRRPRKNPILVLIKSIGARANLLKAIENPAPFEVIVTDFTWIYYNEGDNKAALIGYEDYCSKRMLGYSMGQTQETGLALEAWKKAKIRIRRYGGKIENSIVHQDQGSPFISYEYVKQMTIKDKVFLSYSAKGTPGDNASKESFFGHFKKENKGLFLSAGSFYELEKVVKSRMRYYNSRRRHQTLGYISPEEYLKRWKHSI